jgi:hypothetical protein
MAFITILPPNGGIAMVLFDPDRTNSGLTDRACVDCMMAIAVIVAAA